MIRYSTYEIQPTTAFDASKVPGVNNNTKTNLAGNNYANRTNAFKAVAIGYVGNSNVGWSEVSQAEATRRAIERCEYVSDLPCNVFAEGNTVVFDFTTITWSPRLLTYGPVAYDTLKVPFVREQDRDGNFADIPGRVGNGQRVVAALHVAGYYFIGVDDNDLAAAEDTALTNCNNSVPATSSYNCFVYSRDLNVVMTHYTIVNSRKP